MRPPLGRDRRLEQRAQLTILARAPDRELVQKVAQRQLHLHLLGGQQFYGADAAHLTPLSAHLLERREHRRLLLLGDAELLLGRAQRWQPLLMQPRRLLVLRLKPCTPSLHRVADRLFQLGLAQVDELGAAAGLPHVHRPFDHGFARMHAQPRAEHLGQVAVQCEGALGGQVVNRMALELDPSLLGERGAHRVIVERAACQVLLAVPHRPGSGMLEAGLEHAQEGSIAPRRRVQGVNEQRLVLQRPVEVLQRVHVALEQRRRVEDEHVEEVEGSVAMRADVEGLPCAD